MSHTTRHGVSFLCTRGEGAGLEEGIRMDGIAFCVAFSLSAHTQKKVTTLNVVILGASREVILNRERRREGWQIATPRTSSFPCTALRRISVSPAPRELSSSSDCVPHYSGRQQRELEHVFWTSSLLSLKKNGEFQHHELPCGPPYFVMPSATYLYSAPS